VAQAYVTATVTVWDEDPTTAQERLALVEKTIQARFHLYARNGERD